MDGVHLLGAFVGVDEEGGRGEPGAGHEEDAQNGDGKGAQPGAALGAGGGRGHGGGRRFGQRFRGRVRGCSGRRFRARRPLVTGRFGDRRFGRCPFGSCPFGGRPFGSRPFGGRPFGSRPFGGRPFGSRRAREPYRPRVLRELPQPRDVLRPGPRRAHGGLRHRPPLCDRLQHGPDILRVGAQLGILHQQPHDQRPQRPRLFRLGRIGGEDRGERGLQGRTAEGRPALHGGVQEHAQRPQVGGGAGAAAGHPLGRDELQGADELAADGEGFLALDVGDAEVGEDHAAVGAQQHVGRLDVAVDDADGVRGAQGTEDGDADAGGLRGLHRAALEDLVQGLAAHQLHDDPGQSVLHDDVMDRDGGRMVDASRGAGLAVEAVGGPLMARVLRVAGQPRLFDGDFTVHQLVECPPDGAHTAGADALDQAVTPADHTPLGAGAAPVATHAPCLPCGAGRWPVQSLPMSRFAMVARATSRPRSVKSPLPG